MPAAPAVRGKRLQNFETKAPLFDPQFHAETATVENQALGGHQISPRSRESPTLVVTLVTPSFPFVFDRLLMTVGVIIEP